MLRGTFTTMPLPDLLQWLSDARKSGTLTVAIEFEERTVRLLQGRVTAISADDPQQRDLGRVLVAQGLLSEEELGRALDDASTHAKPFAEALVARGVLAEDQV